ncbi:hypothetical protein GEMRC1_000373 [Eukaryota sp. GEM-RC1]
MTTQIFTRSVDVLGTDRSLFFKRPVLPFMQALSPEDILSNNGPVDPLVPPTPRPLSPPTKTVGTLTDYREADVQTDPYTPDYTISSTSEHPPEVLSLTALTYNSGLPMGQAEVELILNARDRRRFDENLPSDFDSKVLALAEREIYDWKQRELAIKRIQDQEIDQLEERLLKRSEEQDHYIESRVAAHKTSKARTVFNKINTLNEKKKKDTSKLTCTAMKNFQYLKSSRNLPKRESISIPQPNIRSEVDVTLIHSSRGIDDLESFLTSNHLEINIKSEAKKARLSALKKGRGLGSLKDKNLLNSLDLVLDSCRNNNQKPSTSTANLTVTRDDLSMIRRPLTPALRALPRFPDDKNLAASIDSDDEGQNVSFGSVDEAREETRRNRWEIRRFRSVFEQELHKTQCSCVIFQSLLRGKGSSIKILERNE